MIKNYWSCWYCCKQSESYEEVINLYPTTLSLYMQIFSFETNYFACKYFLFLIKNYYCFNFFSLLTIILNIYVWCYLKCWHIGRSERQLGPTWPAGGPWSNRNNWPSGASRAAGPIGTSRISGTYLFRYIFTNLYIYFFSIFILV